MLLEPGGSSLGVHGRVSPGEVPMERVQWISSLVWYSVLCPGECPLEGIAWMWPRFSIGGPLEGSSVEVPCRG